MKEVAAMWASTIPSTTLMQKEKTREGLQNAPN
jgi:hypothetical protein